MSDDVLDQPDAVKLTVYLTRENFNAIAAQAVNFDISFTEAINQACALYAKVTAAGRDDVVRHTGAKGRNHRMIIIE